MLFLGVIGLGLAPGFQAQHLVSADECAADMAVLDSLISDSKSLYLNNLNSLESRDALLRAWDGCGRGDAEGMELIRWAECIHGWLRTANDPHLRVRFESLTASRMNSEPPPSGLLLDQEGPWERLAPGRGISQGARLAWMQRTWAWVGELHPYADGPHSAKPGNPDAATADNSPHGDRPLVDCAERSGMSLFDHGAFLRWKISDFSSGSTGEFRRSFRKCSRRMKRAKLPVMLDLRGNLGGFRTRRHAVLSFFLAHEFWPEERERPWAGGEQDFKSVSPMPAVRSNRPVEWPVAVLVDGLSFSASLLLVDALLHRQRVGVFGVEPLGFPGGCSGSPRDHTLPGSGVIVTVPTLYTSLGTEALDSYGLPDALSDDNGDGGWSDAVRWLLSSDLVSPR